MGSEERMGQHEGLRKWTKPELVVMVRSRPEEAVLAYCKKDGRTGPNNADATCLIFDASMNCLNRCGMLVVS